MLLVGGAACVIWWQIICRYKQLIKWRYEQLKMIEDGLPDSHKVYQKEWKKFFAPSGGKERFGFSKFAAWLPYLFIIICFIYGIVLVPAAAFDCWPPVNS